MIRNKIALSIVSTLLLVGFSGCNSDSQTDNTLSGQVIGSHYEGAKVCQDTNENYKCDENEDSVLTDAQGAFTLNSVGDYPILAEIGTDTKKYSNGELVDVTDAVTFVTMPEGKGEDGQLMLSTLSTAIVARMINENLSFENAKMVIALLSRVDAQDILENFVDGGELTAQEKQLLQTLANAYLLSLQQANGFNNFVTVQSSTATVWRDAAINWTATTGLDFIAPEFSLLLGIGGNSSDPYSEQLSEILTQLTQINEELQKQTLLLTNMDSTLSKIYDFALQNKQKESIDALKINHNRLTTELINLHNIIADQTNEEILASDNTLQNLATILTKENLDFMGSYSRILAGKDGISSISTTMGNFLQARLSYRENALEKNGVDMIEIIDSTNESLMAQYVVYLQDMQAIYLAEMMAIYISKNADKIEDSTLSKQFSRLIINESGLLSTMNQGDSIAKLNEITKDKFESIHNLFKNEPKNGIITNWITDTEDTSIAGEFTAAKEYKNLFPSGDWKKQGVAYVWNKISNNNFTGYYDGDKLTARKDDSISSLLNLSECNSIEFLSIPNPTLVCKELNYKELMGTKNSNNFGYTVVTPYTYKGLNIEKVLFNSKRISVPEDATHAIDSSGKLYFKKGKNQNQIIQYNFHNGEKALFQFSTKNDKKGFNQAYSRIGVDCGVAKGSYTSTCSKLSSNDTGGSLGGHSYIALTSKSGQIALIKVNGRNTEHSTDVRAYMDTCEVSNKNDTSLCRDAD